MTSYAVRACFSVQSQTLSSYSDLARLCNIHGKSDMVALCVQGVIGEGYERLMNPKSVPEEDDYKFHGRHPLHSLCGLRSCGCRGSPRLTSERGANMCSV